MSQALSQGNADHAFAVAPGSKSAVPMLRAALAILGATLAWFLVSFCLMFDVGVADLLAMF